MPNGNAQCGLWNICGMRLRLPHPGWLIPIVLIVGVSATVGQFWWKYRQAQVFQEDVAALGGELTLCYSAPDWLVEWARSKDQEQSLEWLKSEVLTLQVSGDAIDDAWLLGLPPCRRIESLRVFNSRVTGVGLTKLRSFPTLRSLNLDDVPINDADVSAFPALPELRSLSLVGTQVTDAGLVSLKSRTNLKMLFLRNTQITDAGLISLPNLDWLDIAQTHITDAGLAALKPMSKLELLRIQSTAVTDAGLQHLEELPALTEVQLKGTQVTVEGVKRFRLRRPSVKVTGP